MAFKGSNRMKAGEQRQMNELLDLISDCNNKELRALARSVVAKDSVAPNMAQQYTDSAALVRRTWSNNHRLNVKRAVTAIAKDSKDEEQKALFDSLADALSGDENTLSLRSDQSSARNAVGTKDTGMESANQEYARRHGVNIARVS